MGCGEVANTGVSPHANNSICMHDKQLQREREGRGVREEVKEEVVGRERELAYRNCAHTLDYCRVTNPKCISSC